MSQTAIPVVIDDLSTFAKMLRRELALPPDATPGHSAMLGAIARAAGFRNHQHLRAHARDTGVQSDPALRGRAMERALRCFDVAGVLVRWPKQASARTLALWALWAALPARHPMTEREVNEVIKARSDIGDHVMLRRTLIDLGLATRTADGSVYRRVETTPPAEAEAIIRSLRRR